MKRTSILLAAVLLLMTCLTANAQEDEERDILELCLTGGAGAPLGAMGDWHDSLGAKQGWSVGLDFGYFATSNLVVGFNFIYTQMGIDGPDEVSDSYHRLYNPNLYAKYYFIGESNFEPYVKAHIGVENPKFTTSLVVGPKYKAISYDPSLAYGIGAGLFFYSADYSGLYLEVNYHRAITGDAIVEFIDPDQPELEFEDDLSTLDIHVGIRILVGSDE